MNESTKKSVLLLVAGAKGAIGSTLAAAICAVKSDQDTIAKHLTTQNKFHCFGLSNSFEMTGWDIDSTGIQDMIEEYGILLNTKWRKYENELGAIKVKMPPSNTIGLDRQVKRIVQDITEFREQFPNSVPILVNLLPATVCPDLSAVSTLEDLYDTIDPSSFPDMVYVLAAMYAGIPVINFTSNKVEIPVVLKAFTDRKIPITGRDGKTGQTYFKIVLASALKARGLVVNGWYSLNLLGNSDGLNLMDSKKSESKLKNKTDFLDALLEYPVGKVHDQPSHKVHIDYYPVRGDAKEAWDVIDFEGVFGLPMSIRLNLQGRDSILAAPMVLDIANWMAALYLVGRGGPVPELAFYFKKTVGKPEPITFQEQIRVLEELEKWLNDICSISYDDD